MFAFSPMLTGETGVVHTARYRRGSKPLYVPKHRDGCGFALDGAPLLDAG